MMRKLWSKVYTRVPSLVLIETIFCLIERVECLIPFDLISRSNNDDSFNRECFAFTPPGPFLKMYLGF